MSILITRTPLKSLASIFAGAPFYSTTKLSLNSAGVPILNIKDIADGQIVMDKFPTYSLDNFRNAERYLVYPNDILITCRSTQLKSALVPSDLKKSLITSNLIAIRPGGEVLPVFLLAYLRTPAGQKAILANAVSSTLQILLNLQDIGKIPIPVPPLNLQEHMVNLIKATDEQCRLSISAINLRKQLTNQIIGDILNPP